MDLRTDPPSIAAAARDVAAGAESAPHPPAVLAALGADSHSSAAAAAISAAAARARAAISAAARTLAHIAATLHRSAAAYEDTESANTAALGGAHGLAPPAAPARLAAGGLGAATPWGAPPYPPRPARVAAETSPEQFSERLHHRLNNDPESFTASWAHAGTTLTELAATLGRARAACSAHWSGHAADAAADTMASAAATLTQRAEQAAELSTMAAAHIAAYHEALTATPTPAQFADWHAEIRRLRAAQRSRPSPQISAALLAATEQLHSGYAAAAAAAAAYDSATTAALGAKATSAATDDDDPELRALRDSGFGGGGRRAGEMPQGFMGGPPPPLSPPPAPAPPTRPPTPAGEPSEPAAPPPPTAPGGVEPAAPDPEGVPVAQDAGPEADPQQLATLAQLAEGIGMAAAGAAAAAASAVAGGVGGLGEKASQLAGQASQVAQQLTDAAGGDDAADVSPPVPDYGAFGPAGIDPGPGGAATPAAAAPLTLDAPPSAQIAASPDGAVDAPGFGGRAGGRAGAAGMPMMMPPMMGGTPGGGAGAGADKAGGATKDLTTPRDDTENTTVGQRLHTRKQAARLSQLCGGCDAGQLVVADYVGVGLIWGNCGKSCGDEGAAELGEYVFEGGLGLLGVPRLSGLASGEVLGVVAEQCVPNSHESLDQEFKGHGALNGFGDAVACLADAEDLFGGGVGRFDRPPVGVTRHNRFGLAVVVGGEQREVIADGGVGFADQYRLTWGSPERAVPQGIDHRDLHRVGAAVALYRHGAPGRGGGKFAQGTQAPTLRARPATAAGARRCGGEQGGVGGQPRRQSR